MFTEQQELNPKPDLGGWEDYLTLATENWEDDEIDAKERSERTAMKEERIAKEESCRLRRKRLSLFNKPGSEDVQSAVDAIEESTKPIKERKAGSESGDTRDGDVWR